MALCGKLTPWHQFIGSLFYLSWTRGFMWTRLGWPMFLMMLKIWTVSQHLWSQSRNQNPRHIR